MQQRHDHRRKSKRVPVTWKAALVFDQSHGKPPLHTQTLDLSAGGAAIMSEHGDLAGAVVTVLLAHPPRADGDPPKMLKARAKVVSTTEARGRGGYRHGLSFIRTPNDGLDVLEELLQAATSAMQAVQPQAAPAPAPAAGTSRLARLKELAAAKAAEVPVVDPREAMRDRVSEALQRTHAYLKELVEQLDVVRPPYPKGYAILGLPEFSGLSWKRGYLDFRTREAGKDLKIWEQVTLTILISNDRKLKVVRESPATERLRQALTDGRIRFEASETRDGRGAVKNTTFYFEGELSALIAFEGDFENGRIRMRMRNVNRFGAGEHWLAPEALNEASLEEFAGYVLGETHKVGPLILQGS